MRSNNTVFFLFIILVVVGLAACSPSVERLPPAEAASPVPSLSLSTPTASPALLDAATAESETIIAPEPACDLSPALTDQDGILHTSADGAFALSLSADWAAVDLAAGNVEADIAVFSQDFPELESTLRGFIAQSQDGGLWVIAFHKDRDLIASNILPNFNLRLIEDPVTAVLPIDLVVDQTLLSIMAADPQLEILSSAVVQNASGVPVGLICSRRDFSGTGAYTYQRQAIVLAESGMLVFNFAAADAVRESVTAIFDQVIHSLQLLDPPAESE